MPIGVAIRAPLQRKDSEDPILHETCTRIGLKTFIPFMRATLGIQIH